MLPEIIKVLQRRFLAVDAIEDAGQRIAIATSLEFCCHTIDAIAILCQRDQLTSQGHILSRSVFEVGVKTLWAAGTPHGWARVNTTWAADEIKIANEAIALGANVEVWTAKKVAYDAVVARIEREVGQRLAPVPKMNLLLGDVQEILGRARTGTDRLASVFYTHVYRVACGPSHAHIDRMLPVEHDNLRDRAILTVAIGAYLFVEAIQMMSARARRAEIEPDRETSFHILAVVSNQFAE